MPRPTADYNLPVPVLPCYAHLNTHHYLFLNFIRKKIHSSQNRIHVSPHPQISSRNKIRIRQRMQKILRIWISDDSISRFQFQYDIKYNILKIS